MEEKHYEIIVTGRQMALLIASVAVLLVVAFGLGLGVGLQQPHGATAAAVAMGSAGDGGPGTALVAPEPTVVISRGIEPSIAAPLSAQPPTPLPQPSPSPAVLPTPTPRERPTIPVPTPTLPPPTPAPTLVAPTATPVPAVHPAPGGVWVQIGALSHLDQAAALSQRAQALGFDTSQVRVQRTPDGKYRVQLGPFPDVESAGRVVARLRLQGFPDAFMVKE